MHSQEERETRSELTAAEARVLEALSRGLTREEAAVLLGIGLESVKSHLKRIRRVLRAKTTTHAVAQALRLGLIR